jgi:hypothetical protein
MCNRGLGYTMIEILKTAQCFYLRTGEDEFLNFSYLVYLYNVWDGTRAASCAEQTGPRLDLSPHVSS